MKVLKVLAAAISSLALSFPAAAKDSAHVVCAGKGMVLIIDDQRAANGVDRVETVSTIWNSEHFIGINSNNSGQFAKNGRVVLLSPTDESRVYFEGSYDLKTRKNKSPKLRVAGQRWLTAGDINTVEKVNAVLTCIDFSN